MIPSDAVTTIRYQVAETSANFWSNDEIYWYLTMAEREMAALLQCYQVTTAFTTTTSTYSYTAANDFVNIDHVTYDGSTRYKLKAVDFRTLQALDDNVMDSSAQSGEPTHYWRYGTAMILWPTPDASHAVTVYGTKVTTAVVSGSTAFSIPVQFTDYLLDYSLYRMYLKDQDDGRANMHLTLWQDNKARAVAEWSSRLYSDQILTVKCEEDYPDTVAGMV